MALPFVLVLLVLVFCGLASGISDANSTNTTPVSDNQKVFILTLPRSGSTFVGELFRENPDFAYLFEPLRGFSEQFTWDNCRHTPYNTDLEGIMKSIYNCDFSILKKSLPDWGPLYSWDRIAEFSGHVQSCLPPESSQPHARKTSIAIKEIENWAPKLNWLHSILSSELYVVWLVRDVRGWVSSWVYEIHEGLAYNFYDEWGIENLKLWEFYAGCGILPHHKIVDANLLEKIKNILTNSTSPPYLKMAAWWTLDTATTYYYASTFKGKIKLFTYEQMAAEPEKTAKQIYSFLGRSEVPVEVQNYIAHSTRGGNDGDRYNTIRNSTAMTDVWQKRLTRTQIKEIEDIAGVWFPFFEYEKFID
jgi:hypothetical protein